MENKGTIIIGNTLVLSCHEKHSFYQPGPIVWTKERKQIIFSQTGGGYSG